MPKAIIHARRRYLSPWVSDSRVICLAKIRHEDGLPQACVNAYNSRNMHVLGVTGTIGSGKSTVCRLLSEMGCPVVDADAEAHLSYRRGTRTYANVVAAFGDHILDPGGSIDRTSLGRIVFADPDSRARLNSIVHPATHRRIKRLMSHLRAAGHTWAALEATLLIESGWQDTIDKLWVVAAPDDVVVARLWRDRELNESQVRSRMAAQMPSLLMMEHADDIIYNDGDMDALRSRVERLWHDLIRADAGAE